MASSSFQLILTAFLSLSVVSTRAAPSVSFPLNAQLPPVARISEPFSYAFAPQTFSAQRPTNFSLGPGAPSWLDIDGDARRLFGTPTEGTVPQGQVVGLPVDIIATDRIGSTTMESVLVVSRNAAPTIKVPLLEQIRGFGDFSPPSSLLQYPSTRFSFTFASDTFEHATEEISYYAVSADHTPLPAWVKFDDKTLTFSGSTPPVESLIQPPQTFDLLLVASDIVGFSATEIPFSLVVGQRKLTIDNPMIVINATKGSPVSFTGLEGSVKLDGNPVAAGNLSVTTTGIPDWLSLNNDTWELAGTPPDSATSTNFSISFANANSNTLNVIIIINIASNIFRTPLSFLDVTPGQAFTLDLAQFARNPSDTTFNFAVGPPESWIRLEGKVLSGTVPGTQAEGNVSVSVRATMTTTGEAETQTLTLRVLPAPQAPPSGSGGTTGRSGLQTGQIILVSVLPALFVAMMVTIFCFFWRRRRERRHKNRHLSAKLQAREITRPVPGSFVKGPGGGRITSAFDPSASGFEVDRHTSRTTYIPPAVGAAVPSDSRRTRHFSGNPLSAHPTAAPHRAAPQNPATIRPVGHTASNSVVRLSWPYAAAMAHLSRVHPSQSSHLAGSSIDENSSTDVVPRPLFSEAGPAGGSSSSSSGQSRGGWGLGISGQGDGSSIQQTPKSAYSHPLPSTEDIPAIPPRSRDRRTLSVATAGASSAAGGSTGEGSDTRHLSSVHHLRRPPRARTPSRPPSHAPPSRTPSQAPPGRHLSRTETGAKSWYSGGSSRYASGDSINTEDVIGGGGGENWRTIGGDDESENWRATRENTEDWQSRRETTADAQSRREGTEDWRSRREGTEEWRSRREGTEDWQSRREGTENWETFGDESDLITGSSPPRGGSTWRGGSSDDLGAWPVPPSTTSATAMAAARWGAGPSNQSQGRYYAPATGERAYSEDPGPAPRSRSRGRTKTPGEEEESFVVYI